MNTKQTSYSEKLRDPRWQKKRLCVMQRDRFACRDCGDEKSTLQVHHCYYEKGGPWMTRDIFLLTLCYPCHERRGEVERFAKEAFHATMAHLPIEALEVKCRKYGYEHFFLWASSASELMKKINGSLCEKQWIEWRSRRNDAAAHASAAHARKDAK